MTKVQENPDFSKLIELKDWKLFSTGVMVHYFLFSEEHSVLASPIGGADMFKKTGVIADYAGGESPTDNLCVEIEIGIPMVDSEGRLQFHSNGLRPGDVQIVFWKDFVNEVEFTKEMALNIAIMIENEKRGNSQRPPNVKPLFSGKEKEAYAILTEVTRESSWKFAIKYVMECPSPENRYLLLHDLKQAVTANPGMMLELLGFRAYNAILNLL